MKRILTTCFFISLIASAAAQLKVSEDQRFLLRTDGSPFFWLGDTAWELFHRLSREEADLYLTERAKAGFTVIQAVVLAELSGLDTPNVYGARPLLNNDPAKPNEAYFKHVDYVINKAQKLGLIIALLPSWGDKWNKARWGVGPEIFTPDNARTFGAFVGKRYRNKPIVWIMGGDRDPVEPDDFAIIRAMVQGIKETDGGTHLFTFHPQGGKSSSDFFKEDDWLDFHMSQTGHSIDAKNYRFNIKNLALVPKRPHLDGEPAYEDHPNQFDPVKYGWIDDVATRQKGYWSMFSGAFGHTYGNHNIWQFYSEKFPPVSWARTNWRVALHSPGSRQAGYMRKLFEKRPWQRLQPDQSLIVSDNPETADYSMALMSQDGDFMMVYLAYGNNITVNTEKIKAVTLRCWWFNPRDGRSLSLGSFRNNGVHEFKPHSVGRGSDWILVIDDAGKNYPDPNVNP